MAYMPVGLCNWRLFYAEHEMRNVVWPIIILNYNRKNNANGQILKVN